jgi:hypothetical protein
MIWCCITPEREPKTRMMMTALAAGIGREARVVTGAPPDDGNPFVVWGQEWLTMRIVPKAYREGRPFWTLDNGYWWPARGTANGFYRFCYRGMSPVYLPKAPDLRQQAVPLQPWRDGGRHVLIAMPGAQFGAALGIDVPAWCDRIIHRVCAATDRPIRVRSRDSTTPLARDLSDCYALVTHSSNVAVDAAIAGIPVFVEPTSAAVPIGRTDLELEEPVRPGRNRWLWSLASQQFSISEMHAGTAWRWMQRIATEVDGNGSYQNCAA